MSDNSYARQQAREIFKAALENNELTRWQSDLRKLSGLTGDNALMKLLEDPEKSIGDRVKALSERLGEASPGVIRLLSELLARGRLSTLGDISEEYQRLLDNHRGIEGTETAEITTAVPVDNEEMLKIAGRLTAMVGKPVIIKAKVDSEIIGGIIIKIGDRLIDGIIRSS